MDLLTDNIKKLYFKFLLPSLGSAMVLSIYTLTDAIVIGKGVGADALAALSFTTPLLCVLMSTGILFGVGGSVQMNVFRGIGDEERANTYFSVSFLSLALISIVLWGIYFALTPTFVKLMGADEILYPYVMSYMKYINYFFPFVIFSNFIAIFVRADNDPNRAMAGVLLGGVVNIALDIIFVFPMHFGIAGAALASVIGMVVQAFVGISHLFSKNNKLKFKVSRDALKCVGVIVGNGIPSFFNEFANGFIVFLFNIQILKYRGSNALSIYSVISNCVILFNSLFTGVGQSIQPVISQNYGAKKIDRIMEIKKMSYITITVMGAIFSLSGILFPKEICSIFLKLNSDLEQIAEYGIRIYFIAFLPMGINLLTSYYLQAVLQTKKSLYISILRNIVLSGIGIISFPYIFGKNSLWSVMAVVEIIVFILVNLDRKNTMKKIDYRGQ